MERRPSTSKTIPVGSGMGEHSPYLYPFLEEPHSLAPVAVHLHLSIQNLIHPPNPSPDPHPAELFLRMWMCRPSSRVRRCGSLSVTPLPSWLRLCRFAATQRAAPASMLLPRLLPKRTPEARAEAPPPPHAAGVLPLVEDQRIYIVSLQIYCLLN
ncbi:hypothetical protein SORBI_3005G064500 [Sorghum bicolor]|uniref:Uncharacterized protein n=1 Tax=Sorghum bicolor TaxID=4558 RepID=C5Y680_SORBI|nr:hypothetical protein SORBI_3005G064500 [Sorghum bicolor]